MEATGFSHSLAMQCAQPCLCQIDHLHRVSLGSQISLSCGRKVVSKLDTTPRFSCSVKHRVSSVRTKRPGFGAVEGKPLESNKSRLGLARFRSAVVWAKKEDVEHQELEKAESSLSESWTSRVQRANMVSRIFMVTFVWVSLFFGISVANNELGGGRPSRRGPRK